MASIKEKTERVWHIAVANLSISGGMAEHAMGID